MAYVELHAHSYFSLLDGASSPEALLRRAAGLEMSTLALTDHDALYGAIPFAQAAKHYGIRPIFGTELTLDAGFHLTLLVENEKGWRNLCQLISRARHNADKGEAMLPANGLDGYTEGLIALSGCAKGEIVRAIRKRQYSQAEAAATRYRNLFAPGKFWVELNHHGLAEDEARNDHLVELAQHLKIGYVAANNVHYATRDHHPLQDVLVCIRNKTTLEDSRQWRRPNSEYYLKSPEQMARIFRKYPQAVHNSLLIAEQCVCDPPSGLQELPMFPTPPGVTQLEYLRQLCYAGVPGKMSPADADERKHLDHEIAIIDELGLTNYMLFVGGIADFSREQRIWFQGRGAGSSSKSAYRLGITPVDPSKHGLVFERFVSVERGASGADLDIDFQADRREEVIQHIYHKNGEEHTAMACTFVTYHYRSAIRDVGKALGLPTTLLEEIARAVDRGDPMPTRSPEERQLATLCEQISGFPKYLGIHNGGMVITGRPLTQRIPTEPARMENRVVVQWDKAQLEIADIIKIDVLGLRMLTVIAQVATRVEEITGKPPDFAAYDDPAVYSMIAVADTIGVFQFESGAQKNSLPRFKPKNLAEAAMHSAMYRPGPIQAGTVRPLMRRRLGLETVTYDHPRLEAALEETMGVLLYQEQVLKVAHDLAGFTYGQGEQLRRALGGKRPGEEVEKLRDAFMNGAKANDVLEEVAEKVFEGLKAFGGYSFPKSHAASFAVIIYQSAWLKHYYPAEFYTALLNNQPMGFWSPAVIVNDARRHGIGIERVDVNRSRARCIVEGNSIRIGFDYVSGIGEETARQIEDAQREGEFTDLADFCRRTRIPRRLVEHLIWVGAFDQWGIDRRKLVWNLGRMIAQGDGLPLELGHDGVELSPQTPLEMMLLETELMSLSAGEQIMSFYQDWLKKRRIWGSQGLRQCRHGQKVRVAGEVVRHQAPPTAKGTHFITLEDKDGMMNIIVPPNIYIEHRHILRHSPLLFIEGEVQHEGDVTNVQCKYAAILPPLRQ